MKDTSSSNKPNPEKLDLKRYTSLSKLIADKAISKIPNRTSTNSIEKESGAAGGYIHIDDDQKYMLKLGSKKIVSQDDYIDKRDLMQEYISSGFYKRFLFDRVPLIGLAANEQTDKDDNDSLFLKSKFINFSELHPFLEEKEKGKVVLVENIDQYNPKLGEVAVSLEENKITWKITESEKKTINPPTNNRLKLVQYNTLLQSVQNNKLPQNSYKLICGLDNEILESPRKWLEDVNGLGKVLVVSIFCGETDLHASNIGIDNNMIKKVDHGRSTMSFLKNEKDLRDKLLETIENHGYKSLPFNITEVTEISNNISLISEDEIQNIVRNRVNNLKNEGFLFQSHDIAKLARNEEYNPEIEEKNYKIAEDHYINYFINQKKIIEEFNKIAEIISQINYSENPKEQKSWQNGQWLKDIQSNDPIRWAIDNGKTIDNKDPIVWALKYNNINPEKRITIEDLDPIVWALKYNNINPEKRITIEDLDPIEWATKNNYLIQGKVITDYINEETNKKERKLCKDIINDENIPIENIDSNYTYLKPENSKTISKNVRKLSLN